MLIIKSFTYAASCSTGIYDGITTDTYNCNWEAGTLSQTESNNLHDLLFVLLCNLTGKIYLWWVAFHQSLGGLLKFLAISWTSFFELAFSTLSLHCNSSVTSSSTSNNCTTTWLVTCLLALTLIPWDTGAWCLGWVGHLLALARFKVLPKLVVGGVGKDVNGINEALVTAVTMGVTVRLTPPIEGWTGVFRVVWGFGWKALLLPIAELTNSFKGALKVRSIICIEVVKVWFIWLSSRIGIREGCIISVTTLRVEGSFAILLKVVQSSTLPTSIGSCSAFLNIDLVYRVSETAMVAGCTSGDLHHLGGSF